MSNQLVSDSIFWVETDKIKPNPYQPRREFDQDALQALSESIRQYGVLQPLVVTRREFPKEDGGLVVEYELIAGERRLRASKLAGVAQVPVVIRHGENDNLMKLELAIIENLQREDLNPVERARAFHQFIEEFGYKHSEIAKKVGKSREYVSNSLRLLSLPEEILNALVAGRITEGHARPIMMLKDKPEEQMTLFKEIMYKKLTVRDAESIARRSAKDKIRKKDRGFDPEILQMEKELTEQLGTRVHIETREVGGKITIDFFSDEDLKNLLAFMNAAESGEMGKQMKQAVEDDEKHMMGTDEGAEKDGVPNVDVVPVVTEVAHVAEVAPIVAVVNDNHAVPAERAVSEDVVEDELAVIEPHETVMQEEDEMPMDLLDVKNEEEFKEEMTEKMEELTERKIEEESEMDKVDELLKEGEDEAEEEIKEEQDALPDIDLFRKEAQSVIAESRNEESQSAEKDIAKDVFKKVEEDDNLYSLDNFAI
jgi:ParB family chromosome partitioning protein